PQELKKIIAAGESAHVEFKESFGDAVIESLVAMSNAGGGRIIIGVRDNGTVCGIAPKKPNAASWINDIKMKTSLACVFYSNRPLFYFNSATILLNSAMSKT
ncbi:MAG: ATP-binding protein, partial [Nitrospirota bacterium]|nr:ATP-binding protein [Nitrospirota bacterium]